MLRDSVTYLLIRGVSGAIGLASLVVLTRLLDAESYGRFALGVAAINVVAAVLFQWLAAGVARLYAAHAGSPQPFLLQVRRLFWAATSVSLALLAAWVLLRPSSALDVSTSLAIGFGALGIGLYNLHLQLLNSSRRPLRYGLLATTRAGVTLGLAVAAVLAGGGVAGALFSIAVGCAIAVAIYGQRWPRASDSHGAAAGVQVVSYGIPLAMTYLAAMLVEICDRFLIGWWYGSAAVSGYAAAYDLSQQTIGMILNVFYLAAFPLVTRQWESGGPHAAQRAMLPLTRALLLAAPACAAVFIGMPADLVRIMFGPALRADAAAVIPWLAAACALAGLRAFLFDVGLHLERRTSTQLRIMVLTAICNILLNLALLPRLGIVGSAIAATVSASIGLGLSYAKGRRAGAYPGVLGELAKAVVAAAATVTALRSLTTLMPEEAGVAVIAKLCSGLLVFGVAAIALNLSDTRNYWSRLKGRA